MALDLKEGKQLRGRYTLIKPLGKGGFSVVWLADDTYTDTQVAIKIYAPDKGLDKNGLAQFKKEFRRTRNLHHPNLLVPDHFDVLDQTDSPFLIMLYCSDGSLVSLVRSGDQINEETIAKVLADIAGGLAELHKNKVIHQDIKPDNVLIHSSGKYMLTDFGISRQMRSTLQKATANQSYMTVAYSPPERYSATPVNTPASDIFSLGVMLYELCTGSVPWDGAGGMVLNTGAQVPNLPDAYSGRLNSIIRSCMNKNFHQRPTAEQLSELSRGYLDNKFWDLLEEYETTSSRLDLAEPSERKTQKRDPSPLTHNVDGINRKNSAKVKIDPPSGNTVPSTPVTRALSIAVVGLFILIVSFISYSTITENSGEQNISTEDVAGKLGDSSLTATKTNTGQSKKKSEVKQNPPKKDPVVKKKVPTEPTAEVLYGQAMNEFNRTNFDEALDLFKRSAEKGYAPAQNALGEMYKDGEGVTQNYNTALQWFRKAAEKGNADGEYNYGDMYYHGYSVTQNYSTAYKWFSKSVAKSTAPAFAHAHIGDMYYHGYYLSENKAEALKWYINAGEKGEPYAQNAIGEIYDNGMGAAENKAEAVRWYRKAAEQDYAPAQNALGEMYKDGEGVAQNYNTALQWFRKAAEKGNAAGEYNYGDMYYHGFSVSNNYSTAYQWFMKSIQKNDAPAFAYAHIGDMYYNGYHVSENKTEALRWYKQAGERDEPYAQNQIGLMYARGEGGVTQNETEAVDWYRKAAEGGLAVGQYNMGYMYRSGKGVTKNYGEALKWFRKAADQGYTAAKNFVGLMYSRGEGVAENKYEAVRWYREAAEEGLPVAQFNLGYMYQYGHGVSKNLSTAKYWFQKAADQGYQNAKDALEAIKQ